MNPAQVTRLADGQVARLAWENEDALTFELGEGPGRRFVKWAHPKSCLDLAGEAERMAWAAPFTPVPKVLAVGADWLPPRFPAAAPSRTGGRPSPRRRSARSADLAIATWSTGWNFGPGWEGVLLDAYGIAPDEERTRYYRLLWDLSS